MIPIPTKVGKNQQETAWHPLPTSFCHAISDPNQISLPNKVAYT